MPVRALPAVVLGLERHFFAAAGGADHSIGPTAGHYVLAGLIGIGCHQRNLLKGLRFLFHTQIIPQTAGIVKYICTEIWVASVVTLKLCRPARCRHSLRGDSRTR